MTPPTEHPVTWLLPVKDGMPYLRETLASIARQRYRRHSIIAWDNGSTDDSIEELRKWIPGRIKGVVIDDQPMGLGASLSLMVMMADSELCARIDADDTASPDRLLRQVAFMGRHSDVAVLGSGMTVIDAAGHAHRAISPECRSDASVRWNLRFGNPLAHPTVMLRRSMVLDAGNYRDIMPGQDLDLWCRVAARYAMANLPDPLLQYREHEKSVTATAAGSDKHARLRAMVNDRYQAYLFAGLSAAEADRMVKLFTQNKTLDVTRDDIDLLDTLASNAALLTARGESYFARTDQCRAFRRNLVTRYWKGHPMMGRVYPAAHGLVRALTFDRIGYRDLKRSATNNGGHVDRTTRRAA